MSVLITDRLNNGLTNEYINKVNKVNKANKISKVNAINKINEHISSKMLFKTKAQEDCYKKIKPWIEELFKEILVADKSIPLFSIPFRSAITYVIVNPWNDDSIITVRSYVVYGAKLTPELLYFLLRKNVSMRFGAFGIDEDGEIIFECNLIGSTCDKEELNASVIEVMRMSNKYDDEIINKWGGQRAIDLIKQPLAV